MFRTLNFAEYSDYRDFVIMLVILDCGVRINELINVSRDDYNSKEKTITIDSETAKNKETRVLPISTKTAERVEKFYKNGVEYLLEAAPVP